MATDEKAVVSAGSSPTGLTSAPTISVPPRLMAAGAMVGLAAWVGGIAGEHAASPRAIPPAPSHRKASRRLSRCPSELLAEPVRCAVRVIVVPSPGAGASSKQNRPRLRGLHATSALPAWRTLTQRQLGQR